MKVFLALSLDIIIIVPFLLSLIIHKNVLYISHNIWIVLHYVNDFMKEKNVITFLSEKLTKHVTDKQTQ